MIFFSCRLLTTPNPIFPRPFILEGVTRGGPPSDATDYCDFFLIASDKR